MWQVGVLVTGEDVEPRGCDESYLERNQSTCTYCKHIEQTRPHEVAASRLSSGVKACNECKTPVQIHLCMIISPKSKTEAVLQLPNCGTHRSGTTGFKF
jgi:hypothetical protein